MVGVGEHTDSCQWFRDQVGSVLEPNTNADEMQVSQPLCSPSNAYALNCYSFPRSL